MYTYIEVKRRQGWCMKWLHQQVSLHSHAALCLSAVTLTPRSRRASSNKRPIPRWSIFRRNVSLARSPASLLITTKGIEQPRGPSHDTTQANKHPVLAADYIYSRRASSSAIRTETRLCKRAWNAAQAAGISHLIRSRHRSGSSSLLLQMSICLRITDMHQYTHISRFTAASPASMCPSCDPPVACYSPLGA